MIVEKGRQGIRDQSSIRKLYIQSTRENEAIVIPMYLHPL